MKKIVSIIMLLTVATAVRALVFSHPALSGQTLYFRVLNSSTVEVYNPGWDNHTPPTGGLDIPSTVQHEGTTYTVTGIGRQAFFNCSGLTRVNVPASVKNIDAMAFNYCTALDTIELPSTLNKIASAAFVGCGYFNDTNKWENNKLLYIGNYLIKVRTTHNGPLALREGTTGIADIAFYFCDQIPMIEIPSSLRFIGDMAFDYCTQLDTLKVAAITPPTLQRESFNGVSQLNVVVPYGSADAYLADTSWSRYNIIESAQPIDTTDTTDTIDTTDTVAIRMVEQMPVEVKTTKGGIVVDGVDGCSIAIFDCFGRCIAFTPTAYGEMHYALPTTGLYIVSVEGRNPRKIVYLN
ncbi:MAG: leucine-rich repeat domain-containing protein [Bacteroidales bacterium]|nr:leucine-rich repeat domain-containing protein [Bacteroidales bacterium]